MRIAYFILILISSSFLLIGHPVAQGPSTENTNIRSNPTLPGAAPQQAQDKAREAARDVLQAECELIPT